MSALDVVLDYHRRTKHRLEGYAAGPEALDWDAQPAPFRHFAEAPQFSLPLTEAARLPDGSGPAWPLSLGTLGVLLQLSLALTAWKSIGPDRWAVRANPSSGNLHPVEAYLLLAGVHGLPDGLWHYRPETHALEGRALFTAPLGGAPRAALVLASVPWREAWKYGERAFRYCQLDLGHAQASLAQAARLLGWTTTETPLPTATLARLAGTDRDADFAAGRRPDTEREEAELLLGLGTGAGTGATAFDPAPWLAALEKAQWSGPASPIDRHPLYRWPAIDAVYAATRDGTAPTPLPPLLPVKAPTLLARRSAQRFDPNHVLPLADFLRLLAATGGKPGSEPGGDGLQLLLFVHRVADLEPGVYLLPRGGDGAALLAGLALKAEAVALPADALPPGGPLLKLMGADPKRLQATARQFQCHQDLAATGSFSLGMVAPFAVPLAAEPARYRTLLRAAGAIGQALYLQAEALGVRGCGIGCFFDDPVHRFIGRSDEIFQSLYHFAVGLPVTDPRIETLPPYAHLAHPTQTPETAPMSQESPAAAPFHCIPADEAARLVLDGRAGKLANLKILDCRDAQSYLQGHVDGAMNLSGANQDRLLLKLDKAAPILIYCYHGNASKTYAGIFSDFRFKDVYSVDGGYGPLAAALDAAQRTPPPAAAPGVPSAGLLAFLEEWDFDPADLNAPRKNTLTPLMRAALLGDEARVAELLALGVDIAYLNGDGNNALWLACVSGNGAVVQRLLDAGIEKDNRNLLGSTTLMYCASSGKADMLKLLLDNGADPLVENFDDARAADLCATAECLRLLRSTAR